MKVVEKGSVTVTAATSKDTLLLAKKNQVVAEFTVKPTNGAEGIYLENFVLSGSKVTLVPGATTYNCTFDDASATVSYAADTEDETKCIKTTTTTTTGAAAGYDATDSEHVVPGTCTDESTPVDGVCTYTSTAT